MELKENRRFEFLNIHVPLYFLSSGIIYFRELCVKEDLLNFHFHWFLFFLPFFACVRVDLINSVAIFAE